jgi:hypothetical protein
MRETAVMTRYLRRVREASENMRTIKATILTVGFLSASVLVYESPLYAADTTPSSTSALIHVVDKRQHLSFYLPRGFVHEAPASYQTEDLWDPELSVEVVVQNPAGEVTVADGETYLGGWPQSEFLRIRKSGYLHEHFGTVSRVAFTYFPSNEPIQFSGWDLRFIDGLRSFEVIVQAPATEAATAIATEILTSWGK